MRIIGNFPKIRWQALAKGSLQTLLSSASKQWDSRHKAHPGSTILCCHGLSVIVQMRSCCKAKAQRCLDPVPCKSVWKPNVDRYREAGVNGCRMCRDSPPYLKSKISSVLRNRSK